MSEQEIVDAQLNVPIFSPELQIWKTPLSDKLFITGTCEVNKELVEIHNNYPRFSIIHPESETEEDLLAKIKSQGAEMIEHLKKIRPKQAKGNSSMGGQSANRNGPRL